MYHSWRGPQKTVPRWACHCLRNPPCPSNETPAHHQIKWPLEEISVFPLKIQVSIIFENILCHKLHPHHLDPTYICDAKSHEHQSCRVLQLLQKKDRGHKISRRCCIIHLNWTQASINRLCTCCVALIALDVLSFVSCVSINDPNNNLMPYRAACPIWSTSTLLSPTYLWDLAFLLCSTEAQSTFIWLHLLKCISTFKCLVPNLICSAEHDNSALIKC